MATPIRVKRSAVPGKRPTLEQLQLSELALNFYDGHLFAKRDTDGVGIGTTISLLTPWIENYGAGSIYYENNVGIGIATPSSTLDINGTFNVSGVSTFQDTINVNSDINISDVGIGTTFTTSLQIQTPTSDRVITVPNATGTIALVTGNTGYIPYNDGGANASDSGFTFSPITGLSLDKNLLVSGNSTFASEVDISNHLNVSGVSTFSSVNVDGHTELDRLNVSGVSTFTSEVDINAFVDISNDFNVSGASTFASVDVNGHTELDNLNVSGVSTFASVDVNGHTELDNLNVSGVSTFASVDVNGNVAISSYVGIGSSILIVPYDEYGVLSFEGSTGKLFTIGDSADYIFSVNDISGVPSIIVDNDGNINLAPYGDEYVGIGTTNPTAKLDINGNLNVSGVSTFASVDVNGHTELDNLNVSGVSTFQDTVSIGTTIDIIPYDSLGTLSFEGSAGQLFSITNNLTSGSIFSVNDVSGIPSIDVDADGTIQLATYGGNVGLGTTNPTAKLDINGNLNVHGNSTFSSAVDINTNLDVGGIITTSTIIATSTYDTLYTSFGSVVSTSSTTNQVGIHSSLSITTYRSVEYTIQATQENNFYATKILALHDGTDAHYCGYGTVFNNTITATFDVDVSGGNIRLLSTPASSGITTYTINFTATKL